MISNVSATSGENCFNRTVAILVKSGYTTAASLPSVYRMLQFFYVDATKEKVLRKTAGPSRNGTTLAFHARQLDGTDEAVSLRTSF